MTAEFTSTEDMTLVTVLKIRGIEPEKLERHNGGCKWVFRCTDAVQDAIDEYGQEEAYVEPREFARKMGLVRSEMYQFLGIQPRRLRT
jgi:hypothetical protein